MKKLIPLLNKYAEPKNLNKKISPSSNDHIAHTAQTTTRVKYPET